MYYTPQHKPVAHDIAGGVEVSTTQKFLGSEPFEFETAVRTAGGHFVVVNTFWEHEQEKAIVAHAKLAEELTALWG